MYQLAVKCLILAFFQTMVPLWVPLQHTSSVPPVATSSLMVRIQAAGQESSSSRRQDAYWTAYKFEVRPGVAVDPDLISDFSGRVEAFGGTEVFFGTIRGSKAETPNLAIYSLRKPNSKGVERLEIHNLDKHAPDYGPAVHWLTNVSNADSLAFLKSVVESGLSDESAVRATMAIAVHNDPSVAETLKSFVVNSRSAAVRETSIYWLGQNNLDPEFLAELVRNGADIKTRTQAVRAIGLNKNKESIGLLQNLYETATNNEVKNGLLDAISKNSDRSGAADFLLNVVKSAELPIKQHALYLLIKSDSPSTIDELTSIYHAERNAGFKMQILYTLSQMKDPRALERLREIAQQEKNYDVRQQALYLLGERAGK